MADDEHQPNADETGPEKSGGTSGEASLVYNSDDLFRGRREVWIEHGDEMYRLRITSSGKLYLTK